jgi:hypothetical protein
MNSGDWSYRCQTTRHGQYHKLKNQNRITQTDHGLIINARYDPELGLLADEPDHSDALV